MSKVRQEVPGRGDDIESCASAHELLNEANEWLQYSRGISELLAELVHESDAVDCRGMALALEAIGAITRLGAERVAQAHAAMHWEHAKAAAVTSVTVWT